MTIDSGYRGIKKRDSDTVFKMFLLCKYDIIPTGCVVLRGRRERECVSVLLPVKVRSAGAAGGPVRSRAQVVKEGQSGRSSCKWCE